MLNKRILVVNGQSRELSSLDSHLSSLGYEVLTMRDGLSAMDRAHRTVPALAVLGVSMPELDGVQLCRALKDDPITAGTSIILVADEYVEADCILAFEFGADDYVLKTLSIRELTLRICAILRRKANPRTLAGVLTAGAVKLERQCHRVTVLDKAIDITATEFKLLTLLMENAGRAMARDLLLNAAWPAQANVDIRTVDSHVRRLRKKLGSTGNCIRTVRSFGYRIDEI